MRPTIHSSRYRSLVFLLDAVLFACCVLGIYRTAERASIPIKLTEENTHVVVKRVDLPDSQIGLRPGDKIRSVNDYLLSRPKDIELLFDGLEIGESVSFEVEKDGVFRTASVALMRHYGIPYLIIQSVVGSLFFFVGLLVLVKRLSDRAAHVFHWAFVSAALIFMTTWGRYTIAPLGLGHALHVLYSAANAFAGVLFVHFTFLFPRPKWSKAWRVLLPLYGLAALLSFWMGIAFLRSTIPQVSFNWFHLFMTAYSVCRAFFCACFIFAVANFVHSYRTAGEESERRKLRWVMLGLAIAPPSVVIFWQIPELMKRPVIPEEMIILICAIVPITFAISIVQYRVMNVDLIFNRSTVYAVVLAVLLTVYALVVGAVAALIGRDLSWAASAVAAIAVAILFQPVRQRVQRFVDRRFFRLQYNFREAQGQFVEEIQHCLDLQQVANLIVNQIDEILQLERIGVLMANAPEQPLRLYAHRNYDKLVIAEVHLETEKWKTEQQFPMAISSEIEPGIPFTVAPEDIFHAWGTTLILAMTSKSAGICGFLLLGKKRSGVRFIVEDIDLLNTIITQSVLTIEQISLQQKLLIEHAETQRLEELNQLKSDFVSSVTHELKTPLTSIKMFAEILQSQKNIPAEENQEYLEIIEGESDRLTRLIDNVLDFAKVERGVKEYHFSKVNLNEIVDVTLQAFQYQFKMGKFSVDVHLSEDEYLIHVDRDAIIGAITNLLSNAMKYSTERKRISVSTFRQGDFVAIQIADEGIGIPEDDLKNIFDSFYRAKDEKVQRLGGAGLGLALVSHAMEAHGGKVDVQSTPREGSTFTLLFPMEVP